MRYSKKEYSFVRFERSKNPKKKYDGVLRNNLTKREVRVSFGARGYEQYFDRTGLGYFTKDNHEDKVRRKSYRARHKGFLKPGFYTPANFSWEFLW